MEVENLALPLHLTYRKSQRELVELRRKAIVYGVRKIALNELVRHLDAPVFRWMPEAGASMRAVLLLKQGQSFENLNAPVPVSLLLLEGTIRVKFEDESCRLGPGELIDLPPFFDHSVTALTQSLIWMHRYHRGPE